MNQLIFVVISVMGCHHDSGVYPKCFFHKEVIVRAEDLKHLESKKYLLVPVSSAVNEGCMVTLTSGQKHFSGKPCRRLLGF